jgi:hypothetical protein
MKTWILVLAVSALYITTAFAGNPSDDTGEGAGTASYLHANSESDRKDMLPCE